MNLISSPFMLFLLLAWGGYLLLPKGLKPWLLLGASLFFYGTQGALPLLVLLTASALVWLGSHLWAKQPTLAHRRLLRLLGVIVPLLLLASFKYGHLLVPLGISFYIFKLISLSLDQLRAEQPERYSLAQILLYASFFPQMLSGPIDRAKKLIPQFKAAVMPQATDISVGLTRIAWGLFKKLVVADHLALFVNPVFANPAQYQGLNVLMAVYLYAFQIYCDFSGYSDMAIGMCRCFGLRSLENFLRPYTSTSLSEFWSRWHISLSTWLRDYLFLPISYALLPNERSTRWRNLNTAYIGGILVTMLLGGLWHTASWTLIGWGGLHGFYLACGHLSKKWRRRVWKHSWLKRFLPLRPLFARLLTFHLVALAWVFFKAPDYKQVLAVLGGIGFKLSGSGVYHLAFCSLFLLTYFLLAPLFDDEAACERFIMKKVGWRILWLGLLFLVTVIFAVDGQNEFIYFTF